MMCLVFSSIINFRANFQLTSANMWRTSSIDTLSKLDAVKTTSCRLLAYMEFIIYDYSCTFSNVAVRKEQLCLTKPDIPIRFRRDQKYLFGLKDDTSYLIIGVSHFFRNFKLKKSLNDYFIEKKEGRLISLLIDQIRQLSEGRCYLLLFFNVWALSETPAYDHQAIIESFYGFLF